MIRIFGRRRADFRLTWQHHKIGHAERPWKVTVMLGGEEVWTGWYERRDDDLAWNGFAHHLRLAMHRPGLVTR